MRLDELTGPYSLIRLIPLPLLRAFVFAFGLLWGSFLNVVIYRVPREMSVVRPGSHCPACGKPIPGYDNVPLVSYILLRGRARCCGARMSPRYPIVELLGGLLSLAVLQVLVLPLAGETPLARAAAIYLANFSLCLGLVAAAFIDAEHMFLPDSITLGGLVVGVVTATVRGMALTDSLLGAVIGFLEVYLPFNLFYRGFLGRTGMGVGDAKLLALAGAWFGWQGAVVVLFAGAIQGSIYALCARVLGIEMKLPDAVLADIAELEKEAAAGDEEARKALDEDPISNEGSEPFILRFFQRLFGITPKEPEPSQEDHGESEPAPPRMRIPFGPFLILGIFEVMFASEWLRDTFLRGML